MKTFLITCFIFFLSVFSGHAQFIGSGNALNFDGNDYVQLGNGFSSLDLPISICFWVKVNTAQNIQGVFYSSDLSNTYHGFWVQFINGNISMNYGDGTGKSPASRRSIAAPVGNLVPNTWYHFAIVYRSGLDGDIYKNGVLLNEQYSGTGNFSLQTNSTNGKIGENTSNGWTLDGQLDEMSVWDVALTASDVRDLMCKKLVGNEPGLEGYFRFDSNTGTTTLTDDSGNSNGGTLNGSTWVASSAPVGDRSSHNYTSNGTAIGFSPAVDSAVAKLQGNGDDGIHIYFVDQKPNPLPAVQNVPPSVNHYLGVFTADPGRSYNLEYYLNNPALLAPGNFSLAQRPHNASANWTPLALVNNPISLTNRNAPEQFVIISQCPVYDVFPADTVSCDSLRLSLGAPFDNITWFDGSTANPRTFSQPGQVWFTALDTSNGCSVKDSTNIQLINTSNFSIFPDDTIICNDTRVTLNAFTPRATNYQWSNGSTDSATTFNTPGTKWVQVFITGTCFFRDSIDVAFSSQIEPLAEEMFLLCPGEPVNLSVDQLQFINVQWSNGSTQFSTNYNSPGMEWVEAEKPDGCVEVDSFEIAMVTPLDSIEVFEDTVFCKDEPFYLSAPDSLQVIWPNGSDSTYYVSREQIIKVFLSDGCYDATQFFEAMATNCECDVVMPNAFTPNDDGLNDDFGVEAKCEFTYFNLQIFNRWGTLLFESDRQSKKFDGTFKGEKLPQGIYIYQLIYSTDRVESKKSGHLSLIR